jgi:DNA topoisomerase-1
MAKNLVIVESPAKAKTIESYLGKDFIVKSSYGHVRDLVKKGEAIDVENNFEPKYEISADKKALVSELKKLAKEAEIVWLATDEDREGEAISWHLYEALNLKKNNTKRITFHEITKPAILKAIEKPRDIDDKLVDAQQARRILDRLVGFELSPVLWRKVKPSLSAGRVQSVAVRLIVEREREIQSFLTEFFFKVSAQFLKGKESIKAELMHNLGTQPEAQKFLEECSRVDFSVLDVQTKPAKKQPAPPFTTSTLQQEASLKLGFSVSRTMQVAQKLYESGKITYMRTDSLNLSEFAIENARNEIFSAYGKEYSEVRKFKTKTAGAQEAHEAIRPTDFSQHQIDADRDQERLYDLIWKRSIASQMSEAKLERTVIKIGNEKLKDVFQAKGEVIKFDGFLKVYLESSLEEEENEETGLLPAVKVGEALHIDFISATQRFTRPPARFVEASLVKKLEELGIGRPSTYAPTISTIQKRGYVSKSEMEGVERKYTSVVLQNSKITQSIKSEITGRDKNKLVPSDIGMVVNDFLIEHFDTIMDYHFTADVEKQFDDIANGEVVWTKMLQKFYKPFHESVQNTIEHSERASGERVLGTEPKSGKSIIARIGRFGPMVQIGAQDDDEKPQFASLRSGQSIGTITLEEALDLFKLPRIVGQFEDKDMKVAIGRFGPYIQHAGTFTSIGKEDDPMTLSATRAIELIKAKREADAAKLIKSFPQDETMFILNGRWGAYLKIGKNNYKLPKNADAEKITYEDCVAIAASQSKTAKKTPTKKAPAKKTNKKK